MTRLAFAVSLFALASCGVPVCAGASCECSQNETCSFDACNTGTDGCRFQCDKSAACTGSCGANCRVQCGGVSCTHTVGAGSMVQCDSGTCTITCNGPCTAQSSGTLNLTCNGSTMGPAGCE
jgi:hypothetical protein